jgi:hypothetical protein
MMLAAQQPLAKVPSEEIYVTLEKCLDNACAREVESLRATRGLSHESSAVMSCVFDDLKAKVMGGIRQNTTVDPTSTIAGAPPPLGARARPTSRDYMPRPPPRRRCRLRPPPSCPPRPPCLRHTELQRSSEQLSRRLRRPQSR